MKQEKVLFVTTMLGGGGAERVQVVLAEQLSRMGYQVGIAALNADVRDYSISDAIGYSYIPSGGVKLKKSLNRITGLRKLIRTLQPDYVISFMVSINFHAILGQLGCPCKLIISERYDPRQIAAPRKVLQAILYPLADWYVFQTKDAQAYFSSHIQERSSIIPNPIMPGLPMPFAGARRKVIVGIGRLETQKNWPLLLRACRRVFAAHPEYSLTIYGEGSLRPMLERMVQEDGLLRGRVSFPGFVKDVHAQIADHAMYVSSSDVEGMSNAMLEAMAMGLPVVCTDSSGGGAREIIQDGVNGLLTPVGDEDSLFRAICKLIDDPRLCASLSEAGAQIQSRLDQVKIAEEWVACMHKA